MVKADSIVRFTNGIKRYIITAIDKETKFSFAYAYRSHSSDATTDFMKKFKSVAPVSLTHVQTDNGSEFAKHFEIFLEKSDIVHFHTYSDAFQNKMTSMQFMLSFNHYKFNLPEESKRGLHYTKI